MSGVSPGPDPPPATPRRPATRSRLGWLAGAIATTVVAGPRFSPLRLARWSRRRELRAMGPTPFTARGADDLRIAGLRFAAPDRADRPPRLPVVFAHGWLETKECHLALARRALEQGHDVILFDLRAHGQSDGRCTTFGARERLDLAAVIDEAQQRGWLGEKVITMGISLGGSTVLQHAPDDPRVAGVVALAPFVSMEEAVRSYCRRYAPRLSEQWVVEGFHRTAARMGFELEAASTLAAVRRIEVPVLILVGERDRNLSPREHAGVLAAAKSRGPCDLVVVPGANHFNICRFDWPGMAEAVWSFCRGRSESEAVA